MKYIKRPKIIEAIQFTGYNEKEIKSFCDCIIGFKDTIEVYTKNNTYETLHISDYVIKSNNEVYVLDCDTFENTYDVYLE